MIVGSYQFAAFRDEAGRFSPLGREGVKCFACSLPLPLREGGRGRGRKRQVLD
jgi:hypothetical protein